MFAPCTSPQGYAGLVDGVHNFEVRAVDGARNTDPTPVSYAWAVDTTPPVEVFLSPESVTLIRLGQRQAFTETVIGTTDPTATWSFSPQVGRLTADGLYIAPDSLVAQTTVTVTATSNADPTKSASAQVTIAVHSITLAWDASTSNVVGYNIYRANQPSGPYMRLNLSPVLGTMYTDSSVLEGQTYFYVTTAVDAAGVESVFSNEAQAFVAFL